MQAFEYIFINLSDKGVTSVFRPDGGHSIIPEKQHIIVTLNKHGEQGWELVQSTVAQDSSGVSYILKRPTVAEKKPATVKRAEG